MKKSLIVTAAVVFVFAGCQKADNPLLAATDGQFARLVEPKNAFSASCAAALYDPDLFVHQYNGLKFSLEGRIASVSEQQKSACNEELQKRASEVGIQNNVTPEHLRDDRVRQRYVALRKK
jgi:hypothetical protein